MDSTGDRHAGEPPVEMGRFSEISSHDREFMLILIDNFLINTKERLDRLNHAFQERDETTILEEAHAIKGVSAHAGAGFMGILAEQIEELASTGRAGEAFDKMPGLRGEFDRVRQFLEKVTSE